jgi:hypothetical protein
MLFQDMQVSMALSPGHDAYPSRTSTANSESMGRGPAQWTNGVIISIQHAESSKFLQYAKANTVVPVVHFRFVDMNPRLAVQNVLCQFVVENIKGNQLTLKSAFKGDFISVQELDDAFKDGYIATTLHKVDARTKLTLQVDDQGMRFLTSSKHHLSSASVQQAKSEPYDILAACSILPDPSGLFILY